MKEKIYTVGEMAQRVGVAPSTLRYYDKEGLLPFVRRSQGNIRMFRESDIAWLSVIECLKQTGMPIREIKKFVDWCMEGDATIPERLDLIDRQREAVLRQMAQLQETLDTLNYKHWYYETANAAGTCDVHRTMRPEDIPSEIRAWLERNREEGVLRDAAGAASDRRKAPPARPLSAAKE